MRTRTLPILLVSLLLGIAFDWFFVGKIPGISVLLYSSLILAGTFYLAWGFRSTLNKSVYWLVPIILFFSLMVFIRANPFLAFINICIVLYLLLLVVRLAYQPATKLPHYQFMQYTQTVLRTPFQIVGEFFKFMPSVLSSRATIKSKHSYTPIIRGIILSLPIVFIFLLLLSSADLVFQQYITSIFDFSISAERVFRWSLIGFITSLFTGAYALMYMPASRSELAQTAKSSHEIGATESSIILGSVNALFLLFVVIQLAYLFGGSNHISSTNFTYAEYARKGFFELIAVAAISLLLVGLLKKYTVFQTGSDTRVFKWLSGILIALVVIIMFSAHRRLNLYEDAYGFTTLRLFSHLFILWLAYAFGQLFYHIVKSRRDNSYALHVFASLLCFFAIINLINPDNFIATRNIERFHRVGKIDLYYLGTLSEDAVPAIATLLDHPNTDLQKGVSSLLHAQTRSATSQSTYWQSTNVARQRAKDIFRDKAAQIHEGELYYQYRYFDTN